MYVIMNRPPIYDAIQKRLDTIAIADKRILKSLSEPQHNNRNHIIYAGKSYINFSSNDYLGLRHHPYLREKSITYTERYGTSSSSSRLVTGTLDIHTQLEHDLAIFKKYPRTIIFNSGYQANVALMQALTSPIFIKNCSVFSDKLNHASTHDGLKHLRQKRYNHLDNTHMNMLMTQCINPKIAITESIFSMDGDMADLKTWSNICQNHNALSIVDEAHSGGIYGNNGTGMAQGYDIDIIMGTFSKAWGSFGAYIACNEIMHEFLTNTCRGLIYTTSLPPSIIGATQASLDLMPELSHERIRLKTMANHIRSCIIEMGYTTMGHSHIIPIIIGDSHSTMQISDYLRDNGIWVSAIRHPTVPKGTERLRIALSSSHTDAQIDTLLTVLKNYKNTIGIL